MNVLRLAPLCVATTLALSTLLGGCSSTSSSTPRASQSSSQSKLPAIKHVFIITLENETYETTFGPSSPAPYLSKTLAAQGALVTGYFGTGHVSLDNYIAMMSGQASAPDTFTDCPMYQTFALTSVTTDGQAVGNGCVYPSSIKTLPDELTAAGFTWRGYMEDMGNDPTRESATCGHPTLGTADLTEVAEAPSTAVPNGDQYATRHDPFMYFHSIIDSPSCATNVVNLTGLANDISSIATTPNLVFITPNLCDDGHDAPCVTGQPGGLVSADAFLKTWVPQILASPAYQADGLLIINFDESAPASSVVSGTSYTITFNGRACCGQQPGPNVTYPATLSLGVYHGLTITEVLTSLGGDNTGAVLLSKFIKPGTVSRVDYNHYSMLKTLQDIFGVQPYLGYAGQTGLARFGSDIFTNSGT